MLFISHDGQVKVAFTDTWKPGRLSLDLTHAGALVELGELLGEAGRQRSRRGADDVV